MRSTWIGRKSGILMIFLYFISSGYFAGIDERTRLNGFPDGDWRAYVPFHKHPTYIYFYLHLYDDSTFSSRRYSCFQRLNKLLEAAEDDNFIVILSLFNFSGDTNQEDDDSPWKSSNM
jgi:hypothetical protein